MSEANPTIIFDNLLVTMPYIIYVSSFFTGIVANNYEILYFTLYVIIFGDGLNALTKKLLKKSKLIPDKLGLRPSGCGGIKAGNMCRGCGIFPSFKDSIGSRTFGFPSGHAQITSLAATFWIIYLLKKNKSKKNQHYHNVNRHNHYISIILIIVVYLLVCRQRIKSKCHNIFQIVGGTIQGFTLGISGYYLCNKIAPKTYPL